MGSLGRQRFIDQILDGGPLWSLNECRKLNAKAFLQMSKPSKRPFGISKGIDANMAFVHLNRLELPPLNCEHMTECALQFLERTSHSGSCTSC